MTDTTTLSVNIDAIAATTESRVVEGIKLPYTHKACRDRPEETGEVFIDASTLVDLADQGVWDSQLGKVLLLDLTEGLALEQAGLAVKETRGGFHATDTCKALVSRLGWA